MDLLGGLNLSGASSAPLNLQPSQTALVPQTSNAVDLLGDLFGTAPVSAPLVAPVAALTFAPIKCYEKNGLNLSLATLKESATMTQIKASFSTTGNTEISNVLFQVAVPKVS
jgi:hypothetical protein